MLLSLSDANHPTDSSELKIYSKSDILIVSGNEKLDTMLSQVGASQNSRLTIGNTHNGIQYLASIITERFDNTLKKKQIKLLSQRREQKRVPRRVSRRDNTK